MAELATLTRISADDFSGDFSANTALARQGAVEVTFPQDESMIYLRKSDFEMLISAGSGGKPIEQWPSAIFDDIEGFLKERGK